ncbi:MAG: 4Fe-4S binding protein [Candidatus Altiarchaeota archaeon]
MQVNRRVCLYCGGCVGVCPQNAIELRETLIDIDQDKCNDCGLCFKFCPAGAMVKEGKR